MQFLDGCRHLQVVGLLLVAILTIGLPVSSGKASGLVAKTVTIEAAEDTTVFRLGLSAKAAFTATPLAEPYRIVVEFPDVNFALADDAGAQGKGLIERFRFGASAPGKSRIVLHLKSPTKIVRSGFVTRASGQPIAFELVLAETDVASFEASATGTSAAGDVFPILTPPKPGDIDECKIRQLIVLDPGHGGIDSGAVSPKGTKEKDVVLAFAKILYAKLKKTGRYRVMMTRDTDVFVPLKGRVAFAANNRACLFLSLHADSADDRRYDAVGGGTVYTRSDRASDEEAALTALKENAADEAAGMSMPKEEADPISNWLEDLWGKETREHNVWLADILVPKLKAKTKMTGRPHRQAAFFVLKSPLTPSALIELAFISNREDEKNLKSDQWRERIADAIVVAVDRFFKERHEQFPISSDWLPAEN